MNKLLDIKRAGGFPVDAEVIELLYNYKDYIESILGGLELAAGSVLFLEANQNEGISGGYYLTDSYVYVVPVASGVYGGTNAGKIKGNLYKLKADSTITIADLLAGTAAKLGLQINETKYSTVDEYNVTYSDYMSLVELKLIVDAESPYSFYRLSDVMEFAKYRFVNLTTALSLWDANVALNTLHTNFIKSNATKVIIQLGIKYTSAAGTDYDSIVDITLVPGYMAELGLSIGEIYPLLCVLKTAEGEIYNVPCILYRSGAASIKIQLNLKNLGFITTNDVFEIKGELFL
jgi:hypothetical protein